MILKRPSVALWAMGLFHPLRTEVFPSFPARETLWFPRGGKIPCLSASNCRWTRWIPQHLTSTLHPFFHCHCNEDHGGTQKAEECKWKAHFAGTCHGNQREDRAQPQKLLRNDMVSAEVRTSQHISWLENLQSFHQNWSVFLSLFAFLWSPWDNILTAGGCCGGCVRNRALIFSVSSQNCPFKPHCHVTSVFLDNVQSSCEEMALFHLSLKAFMSSLSNKCWCFGMFCLCKMATKIVTA